MTYFQKTVYLSRKPDDHKDRPYGEWKTNWTLALYSLQQIIDHCNLPGNGGSTMDIMTVTSKGQVVIPAKIRKRYGLSKGARLCIEEHGDELILRPLTPEYLDRIAGILKGPDSLSRKLLQERARDKQKEA